MSEQVIGDLKRRVERASALEIETIKRLDRATWRAERAEAALRQITNPPMVFATDDAHTVADWFVGIARAALAQEGEW